MKPKENVPLALFTTMRVGGSARYFFDVSTVEELCEALSFAKDNKLPFFMVHPARTDLSIMFLLEPPRAQKCEGITYPTFDHQTRKTYMKCYSCGFDNRKNETD